MRRRGGVGGGGRVGGWWAGVALVCCGVLRECCGRHVFIPVSQGRARITALPAGSSTTQTPLALPLTPPPAPHTATDSAKLEQLASDDSARAALLAAIKGHDDALTGVKAQEEVLRQTLADMRAREADAGADVPALLAERDECREVCKAAWGAIQDLRAAHDAAWAAFKEGEKVWRAQRDEDRKSK